ncbi:MAG TPA: PspC domain-containing protein [Candidatus Microsaccharimonas sp.]|nr:PspC domain-containing protein [Candidatus Microsaccharimonas sp.]
MNEVTQIHLGRESFTIAVDARKMLEHYLREITRKLDSPEVIDEVEMRMAELLLERGAGAEKVVLPQDIEFLQEQLGSPDDFGNDEDSSSQHEANSGQKRLFRDTDNGMIAGVAAGIGNYLGIDAVIIRLIFIALIFGGASGIIIYLLLWLVVPPATTTSEKLQMKGKAVNLDALKDSVRRADLSGTAQRVNQTFSAFVNSIFRVVIKLAGIGFVLIAAAIMFGVAVARGYMTLHGNKLFQEGIFPVGVREHWLVNIMFALLLIVALFLALVGIATFKRKWPVRGWITGVLVGLFLVGSAASFALAADAAPRVQERYETLMHTTAIKGIQPFQKVVTEGDIDIEYVSSPTYAVNVHYADNPDLSKLKIHVDNGVLTVDSRSLDTVNHCAMLCLFPRYNMTVQIYAPNVESFVTPPKTDIFYPDMPVAPVAPAVIKAN